MPGGEPLSIDVFLLQRVGCLVVSNVRPSTIRSIEFLNPVTQQIGVIATYAILTTGENNAGQ